MGRDKALVAIDGVPMVIEVIDRLRPVAADAIFAIGAAPEVVSLLDSKQITTISDKWPGEGPAGGVLTAIETIEAEVVIIVACDHPDLRAEDLSRLVATVHAGAPAAVAKVDGRLHPSVGAWDPRCCRELGAQFFTQGGRSLHGLAEAVGAVSVDVDYRSVSDVDTPADAMARYGAQVSDSPEVDVTEFSGLVSAGARVVDVRQPDEYVEGHVPGAVLVPLASVPDHPESFEGGGPVYVVCRSGARSLSAVEYLRSQGVDAINVSGGTLAWIEAGNAVVIGDSPR